MMFKGHIYRIHTKQKIVLLHLHLYSNSSVWSLSSHEELFPRGEARMTRHKWSSSRNYGGQRRTASKSLDRTPREHQWTVLPLLQHLTEKGLMTQKSLYLWWWIINKLWKPVTLWRWDRWAISVFFSPRVCNHLFFFQEKNLGKKNNNPGEKKDILL